MEQKLAAVIPAAGLGTRMGHLIRSSHKELLPIRDRRPLIHHAVEEALLAGCNPICVIIRKDKETIRDYLRNAFPKEKLAFIDQPVPLGVADATARAAGEIGGSPFLLFFLDQLLKAEKTAAEQLVAQWKNIGSEAVVAPMVRVKQEHKKYFTGSPFLYNRLLLDDPIPLTPTREIVGRRPELTREQADWFFFGRIIFPAQSIEFFPLERGSTTERPFAKFYESITAKFPQVGVRLKGEGYDAGTLEGYEQIIKEHLL